MKDRQWIPELQRRCRGDVQMCAYRREITCLRRQLLKTLSPQQIKLLQMYESRLTDFSRLLAKLSHEIGLEQESP